MMSDARGSLGRYIAFYTRVDRIRVLTGNRRIGRTPSGCRYSRRHNPAEAPLRKPRETVQTNRATSSLAKRSTGRTA
jgi:hypothetical protein